jgi:hypothetical protein
VNPGPQGAEGTYTALLKIREVIPEVSYTPGFFFSRSVCNRFFSLLKIRKAVSEVSYTTGFLFSSIR